MFKSLELIKLHKMSLGQQYHLSMNKVNTLYNSLVIIPVWIWLRIKHSLINFPTDYFSALPKISVHISFQYFH